MVDLVNIHPNARKYIPSENPKYVTARRKEFKIHEDGPFFVVKPAKGGITPPQFRTRFTSFKECERTLVNYLKSTENPILKAIYPEEYGPS
jgi:hypothetical protein